jgi:hypothetical protein
LCSSTTPLVKQRTRSPRTRPRSLIRSTEPPRQTGKGRRGDQTLCDAVAADEDRRRVPGVDPLHPSRRRVQLHHLRGDEVLGTEPLGHGAVHASATPVPPDQRHTVQEANQRVTARPTPGSRCLRHGMGSLARASPLSRADGSALSLRPRMVVLGRVTGPLPAQAPHQAVIRILMVLGVSLDDW